MSTLEAVIAAAERLNKANVRDACNVGTRNGLYRNNMSAEARALDEAFQTHYEAQQPQTINAADIGFTLKSDQKTMDAIAADVARKAPPRAMR